MKRIVVWQPWEGAGIEYLDVKSFVDSVEASGTLIRIANDRPLAIDYQIRCDTAWRVRHAAIEVRGGPRIELASNGEGRWNDGAGGELGFLSGCIDLDVAACCFTNTLPVRRLSLAEGCSDLIDVAYVAIPALEVTHVQQRYTRLPPIGERAVYRYEGLSTRFTADVSFDTDGIVIDYPQLARRVF